MGILYYIHSISENEIFDFPQLFIRFSVITNFIFGRYTGSESNSRSFLTRFFENGNKFFIVQTIFSFNCYSKCIACAYRYFGSLKRWVRANENFGIFNSYNNLVEQTQCRTFNGKLCTEETAGCEIVLTHDKHANRKIGPIIWFWNILFLFFRCWFNVF